MQVQTAEAPHEILHSELQRDGGRPHLEVQGLMEIEFELCQRDRLPIVLVRVAVDGLPRLVPQRERQDALLCGLVDILRSYPRTGALYAYREGATIVVLLPRTTIEAAELMCRLLIEAARKLALPDTKAIVHASLSIGLAQAQPDLDLHFETLSRVADEGVMVASASGSECFVHTQLYGLFQRKLDREKPRKPRAVEAPATPAALAAPALALPAGAGEPVPSPASASLLSAAMDAEAFAADPHFDAQIRAEIARAGDHGSSFRDLEGRLLALAHTFARGAIERALENERDKQERELDKLHRRITKLARTLEDTEEELRRVENHKSVDRGVSSAYRFVQGLSAKEEGYQHKLGLLAAIVEANLALQKNLVRSKSA